MQAALEVASNVGPYLFPLGRIVKVVRSGYKVTNSTNPLMIGANITLTVLECCAPPPVKLFILWVKSMINVRSLSNYNVWVIKKYSIIFL